MTGSEIIHASVVRKSIGRSEMGGNFAQLRIYILVLNRTDPHQASDEILITIPGY